MCRCKGQWSDDLVLTCSCRSNKSASSNDFQPVSNCLTVHPTRNVLPFLCHPCSRFFQLNRNHFCRTSTATPYNSPSSWLIPLWARLFDSSWFCWWLCGCSFLIGRLPNASGDCNSSYRVWRKGMLLKLKSPEGFLLSLFCISWSVFRKSHFGGSDLFA